MELAKTSIDIGLRTNAVGPMLRFWQNEVGLPFDGLLKISDSQQQHRHGANGTVLKVNEHSEPLPASPPSGYLEVLIACRDVPAPKSLIDPEGTFVTLVPSGFAGITQVGVRMVVRDIAAHRRFYRGALGLMEERPGIFRAGESVILVEQGAAAPEDAQMYGRGFRYITFQVSDGVGAHRQLLAAGGREGRAPVIVNSSSVVSVSMVRDLDGNWIELLQRP